MQKGLNTLGNAAAAACCHAYVHQGRGKKSHVFLQAVAGVASAEGCVGARGSRGGCPWNGRQVQTVQVLLGRREGLGRAEGGLVATCGVRTWSLGGLEGWWGGRPT